MRESLASAARLMSKQPEALADAHLVDEGSTMRIMELGSRNELAEDGAQHIIHESVVARQRYHSELENAVRHIQEQHHNAEETAEQFRQQRERLQQECHEDVAEKEDMNRQEMATITSRLAANAEMVIVMMNNENLQATSQNAVMIRDQQLANMQSQITEFAGNMRQKDLEIEDLKRKLRDQIAYAGKLKTLSYSVDLDAKMSLRDSELTLKSEITEQRRLMSNCEHECISERMIADQLRRDKSMILDNEAVSKQWWRTSKRRALNHPKSTTNFDYASLRRRKELRNSERRRKEGQTLFRCGQFVSFPDASLNIRRPSTWTLWPGQRESSTWSSSRTSKRDTNPSTPSWSTWTPRSTKKGSVTRVPYQSLMDTTPTLGQTRTASSRHLWKGIWKPSSRRRRPRMVRLVIGGKRRGSVSSRNNWHANHVQDDEALVRDRHDMCRMMKHLFETGMKPTSFNSMFADDMELDGKGNQTKKKFVNGEEADPGGFRREKLWLPLTTYTSGPTTHWRITCISTGSPSSVRWWRRSEPSEPTLDQWRLWTKA